jgi:hypothetical protein
MKSDELHNNFEVRGRSYEVRITACKGPFREQKGMWLN